MPFRKYLNESKPQLDVAIQAVGNFLTSKAKTEEFLTSDVTVEHKTDGVKLTVIKKDNKGNINDYIFAYKGNILYHEEYDFQPTTRVKSESVGASQFKLVFKHFQKLPKNSIPVGTELFIEFLMSKQTLSSNYSTKHKMVLIGHSKSTWAESFGKLKTNPDGFGTELRDQYAKELRIHVPAVLFQGVLGSEISFEKGILNKKLKAEFDARRTSITWNIPEILLDDLREMFLAVESRYGGREEGVVLKFHDRMLKWQQDYQLDKEARYQIKLKYKETEAVDEARYWENVKRTALSIMSNITIKSRKLPDLMEELSLNMKRLKLDFRHSKKTTAMIKDDIQLNAKTLIIKNMRGNNNALFIGKFRVLQNMHYQIIKRGLKLYDDVIICLVTSNDTKETKDLREKMLRAAFPGITIIYSQNGNLITVLNKAPKNINTVLAGTDRVSSYKNQLKNSTGVDVRETPRISNSISATEIIRNIQDVDFFKQNTPSEIHHLYGEILKAYK